jgi:predicted nucleic acid-binding Zn ribbon protein
MGDVLNTLTFEELDAMREAAKPKAKHCLTCDKEVRMKPGQLFCSPACRVRYAREQARVQYEALMKERQAWTEEREALVREVQELRKQLATR